MSNEQQVVDPAVDLLTLMHVMERHQISVRCERYSDEVRLTVGSFTQWESSEIHTYPVNDGPAGYAKALKAAVDSFMQANNLGDTHGHKAH